MSTSPELRFVLALLVAVAALAGTGCSGSGSGRSEDRAPGNIVAELRKKGISLRPTTGGSNVLGVRSRTFAGPDGSVQIFRFDSSETARVRAAGIDPHGYSVGHDGSVTQIEWTSPPHWFRTGSSIVLYLGTSARMLAALQAVAGPQFAGA